MDIKSDIITAPIVTFARHRMQTDGQGVTTLVCFYGCPLRCKMCLNPFTFSPDTNIETLTAAELYERVKLDELYFLATNGGVTFGGGEPLLYPDFLTEFRNICGKEWHNCVETSLNVPPQNVRIASGVIDHFIVDCKDTNPDIYKAYTGKNNTVMLENLKLLTELVSPDRITVRVPLITNYNTQADREKTVEYLHRLGITDVDLFEYIDPKNRDGLFKKK